MSTGLRFLPHMHLRRPADFERVYEFSQRAGDRHLLVFARPNELGYTRLGMSVSRRHGPAVVRNLKRRRMRESFRLNLQRLPVGLDLVLVPRQGKDSTLNDFQVSLTQLTDRLAKRLLRSPLESGPMTIDPERKQGSREEPIS